MTQASDVASTAAPKMETQEEDYDIPPELETVIGRPLEHLPEKKPFLFCSLCLFHGHEK